VVPSLSASWAKGSSSAVVGIWAKRCAVNSGVDRQSVPVLPHIRGLCIYRGNLPAALCGTIHSQLRKQHKQHDRGNSSLRLHGSLWATLYSSTHGDNPGASNSFAFAICTELFPGESARL